MKVMLLSPLPPPIGGIASWTVNILRYYDENSNELIKLTHQDTAIKYGSVTKKKLRNRLCFGVLDGLRLVSIFYYYLFKYKPDIVHVNSSASLGLLKDLIVAFSARLTGTPVVIHYHFGRIPDIIINNGWEWRVLRVVNSLCSAIVVLDRKSCMALKSNGCRLVYIIPNPVSIQVKNLISKPLSPSCLSDVDSNKILNIIFVGHIVISKGVFELVHACSHLNSNCLLTLIGPYEEGTKQSLLEAAAGSMLLLKFTGVLEREAVYKEMSQATLLALPSYTEGFPNVIIEAMAMKCAIVATDVGAISDMLDVHTSRPAGLVVEPKNIPALTEAISRIIFDKKLSESLKCNAFIKVNTEYTLNNACALYEDVWYTSCRNRDN